jgi:hypothetical protein
MSFVATARFADLRPLVVGVTLWIANFYWAMNRQSATRRRLRSRFLSNLKKEDGLVNLSKYGQVGSMSFMRNEPAIVNNPEFIRADRTFLNLVEQAAPFFVSLVKTNALIVLAPILKTFTRRCLLVFTIPCWEGISLFCIP